MYQRIDSSTIVAYLAEEKFGKTHRKSISIKMKDIYDTANKLQSGDSSYRINLGYSSFEYLKAYSGQVITYNNTVVQIADMGAPGMRQILHQYYPKQQILEILQK